MKPVRLIIGVIALSAFASCSKKLSTDPLSFSVTTSSTTYHVGDTVHFTFNGNPDFISVYSGENGNNYAYKSRTTIAGTPQLQFTSYVQYGTATLQPNSLQLLVSNNFNGAYDTTDINSATWTDITSRATLSTGANNTPSGIVDLSDFLAQQKPIFVAFKYNGTTGSTQRTWTINNLTFNLLLADSTTQLPITTLATAGWKNISFNNPVVANWSITLTGTPALHIAGGAATAGNNNVWVISQLLYLNSVSPDVAVPIKNITQKVTSYDHVFTQPGTYKVVFLAVNATADEQQSVTKEVDLTIQ